MGRPNPFTPRSKRIGHDTGSFMTIEPKWSPRETASAKGGRSMTVPAGGGPRTTADEAKGCKMPPSRHTGQSENKKTANSMLSANNAWKAEAYWFITGKLNHRVHNC